jgi:hypothetical protein
VADLPLANGIIIDTQTGQALNPKLAPDQLIAKENKPEDKRRVQERGLDTNNKAIRISTAELPADPQSLNTAGIVWMYFYLGLNDVDIAACTGLRVDQVSLIKGMKLFMQLNTLISDNIAKLNSFDIEARIHKLSGNAMTAIEGIIDDEEVEAAVKLRAAQDLLDRAGHSAKHIIEKRTLLEGGLVIKHVTADSKHELPEINLRKNVIDITPNEEMN